MLIQIVSLSGHRIDELLADYAYEAIRYERGYDAVRGGDISEVQPDQLWVFNGVYGCDRSKEIVELSKTIPTLYFWDDHSLPTFGTMTTVSQFEGFGEVHFQISELAVFDRRFERPYNYEDKEFYFTYWGHQKTERLHQYSKFILDEKDSMLIGDWSAKKSTILPYERDMDKLYKSISTATYTTVFGDEVHNGRSIPLRVYEAAMNHLVVLFDRKLIEGQKFSIDEEFIIDSLDDRPPVYNYAKFRKSLLKGTIIDARERVKNNLLSLIKEAK